MKTILAISSLAVAFAGLAHAQIGRTFDWHTAAGDAQRSGWEKTDTKFTKEGVKDFKLVFARKLEGAKKKSAGLMPPVVLGTLVSYRGFKELAFVANNSGDIWALDVDLDKIFWQRSLDLPKIKAKACAGVTSEPTMEPGAVFGARRRKGAAAAGSADFYRRIFAPREVFLLASDGKLYRLDTSTGKDMHPPVPMMPAGARAANLNATDDTIYTTAGVSCGAPRTTVLAADLSGEKPKVTSFPSPTPDGFVGANGIVLGSEDEVYAQTSNTLQSLSPKDLKLQQTFSAALGQTSPVAFTYKDHDLLVTAAKNGSLYLLDSKSLSLAVSQTAPVAGNGDRGLLGLSTWESSEGVRWVAAAVSGPLDAGMKCPQTNGAAPNGSIVAFKLTEEDGKPTLSPAWVSRDLSVPQTPVVANGVVFALSSGEYNKKRKLSGHATLFALDGETGKEIYSTGEQAAAPANPTGLTMANGRVYFTTTDNTLYAFGYNLEH